MPVDTSIYGAFSQPAKSTADYDAQYDAQDARRMALQTNALALQSGRQKLDEYQRGVNEQGVLRNALMGLGAGATDEQRIQTMRGTGLPGGYSQADALQKTLIERDKGQAESRAKQAETMGKVLTAQGELATRVIANPTRESALAAVANMKAITQALGVPLDLSQDEQQIAQMTDPAQITRWAQGHSLKATDFLAKLQQVNNGKTTSFVDMNSVSNPGGPAPIAMTTTPGEDLTATTSTENNKRTVDASLAGQRSVAATAAAGRAQADRHFTARQDAEKPEKPLPPSVLKQVTEARDNAATIDRLASSFKPEFSGKGVFGLGAETQLSVSGNLGADRDAVEWWKNYRKQAELVERHALFGAALTPTEQSSWRSADIGPGMDAEVVAKNLATRKELSAKVADATRQDMIDAGHSEGRISKIAGRSSPAPSAAPSAGPTKITDDAGYNALPSGAKFIGPDGKTRRKP